MTLIELTVVILVLLALIAVLFIGARAWKAGSDRAGCIMNIRKAQMSVRSLSNLSGFTEGQDVSPFDVENALIGPGAYIEAEPSCPGSGVYTLGGNLIPARGVLYMTCSLAAGDRHEPEEFAAW